MSDKCFKKCIYKPGTSLDNSEQVCFIFIYPLEGVTNRERDGMGTLSVAYPRLSILAHFAKKM